MLFYDQICISFLSICFLLTKFLTKLFHKSLSQADATLVTSHEAWKVRLLSSLFDHVYDLSGRQLAWQMGPTYMYRDVSNNHLHAACSFPMRLILTSSLRGTFRRIYKDLRRMPKRVEENISLCKFFLVAPYRSRKATKRLSSINNCVF